MNKKIEKQGEYRDVPGDIYDGRFVCEGYGAPEVSIRPKKEQNKRSLTFAGLSVIEIGLLLPK